MKLLFLKAGRFAHDQAPDWAETYFKRLKRGFTVEARLLKEGSVLKTLTDLRKHPETRIVLLDERGEAGATKAFSQMIGRFRDGSVKEVVFVVGGSHGFTDDERKLGHVRWSLGPLTLAGDIAWIVLVEQVYRAVTILEGHPYHHE